MILMNEYCFHSENEPEQILLFHLVQSILYYATQGQSVLVISSHMSPAKRDADWNHRLVDGRTSGQTHA
jgi:hypothetical protein